MKRLSVLGIIGGAALLAAVPFSLQWSQEGSAVPLLTLSQANAQYYGPYPRHVRRVYRRAYRRAYYGGYYGGYRPYSYGGSYPYSYGGYGVGYGGYGGYGGGYGGYGIGYGVGYGGYYRPY